MSLGDYPEIIVLTEFSREFLAIETNRSQFPQPLQLSRSRSRSRLNMASYQAS